MTKQIWNELSKINANEYKEKKVSLITCLGPMPGSCLWINTQMQHMSLKPGIIIVVILNLQEMFRFMLMVQQLLSVQLRLAK